MNRLLGIQGCGITRRRGRRIGTTALPGVIASLLLVGCAANPKQAKTSDTPATPSKPGGALISNNDPSAIKMHDIEGAILMYFAINKTLPEHIADALPLADEPLDLKVPGSLTEYIYTRDGIKLQDQEARYILYEPAPMHSGFRLAIKLNDPEPFKALVMQVIPVPESFFLLHPPATAEEISAERESRRPVPPPLPAGAAQKSAERDIRR